MAIASSRRHGRNHVPPMARGAINPNAETALLLWRRCGRPGCGRLLLRRCLCRSRGGRCRCLRLGLCRRLGGRLLFSTGFLTGWGGGAAGVNSTCTGLGWNPGIPKPDETGSIFSDLRLVAVEREGNGHRRIGRQRQSARCAAGLPVGGLASAPGGSDSKRTVSIAGAGFSASVQSDVDEHAARASPPLTIAITRYII